MPARAGPSPNLRHGGVARREGRPGLIQGWRAAWRAELGPPGLIWATSISRLPLRRGGRGSPSTGPSPNLRNGGVAQRERRPGFIGGRMSPGQAELGRSGFNRATSVSRPPLRRGERGPVQGKM